MDFELPKIISLFSGAGGLDLGFQQAGFTIIAAMDHSRAAVATHRHNFPDTVSITADLQQLGASGVVERIKDMVQPGTAIAVIGGPPCQGFTTANVKADSNDPRNQLVLLYLDIIAALQQQYTVVFTVLENVPGLLGIKHADTVKDLFSKYDGLRHETVLGVHNAIDFGVAQERKRVIFTSFNDPNNAARFGLHPTSTAKHTVREMIGTLPEPAFFARHMPTVPFHANHWTMQPRSKRFTTPNTSGKSRSFRRLQWDKPSPTVAYGNREIHVHPMGHRRLSVYEAMLLQGFPPDFELKGSFSEQVEQISNAVPVPLAKALAESIKHALIGGVQWPTLLSA